VYPELFRIGPFPVYSFGLMMAIGFLVASYVLSLELQRKGHDPRVGSTVTLLALIFGLAGSKLNHLIENWHDFLAEPSMAFSPGGLTWYGGFALATLAIFVYARRQKIPFGHLCDAAAPALILGYGIARIGCHLSGDGDYGMPTDLPWAAVYSNGTYPPTLAFRDFPDIVAKYGVNGVVPNDIPVHPTPVYEFFLSVLVFLILWNLRKKMWPAGRVFSLYLVLAAVERFAIEFLRVNPRLLFGLSEAQLVALVLMVVGTALFLRLRPSGAGPPST
jgi:phosphatidylglycerol:prolipoprotein diacylglycerol transferase